MANALNRRSLVVAAPAAVLVASLPAPATAPAAALPSQASIGHPDVELLGLVASFEAAEARREQCDRRSNAAFDRIEFPEIPKAMIWRKSDWPGISSDHPNTRLPQYDIGGKWEYLYESLDVLPSRWTGLQPPPFVYGTPCLQDRERAAEIIAAIGEWQAANRRAEDAAGYTAACEAADQQIARCDALRHQIIFARAHTPEGMMAKVRAMILHFPDDPAWVQQRLEEAAAAGGGADCARWFGMSLALDAMGIKGRTLPASKPRSVAS